MGAARQALLPSAVPTPTCVLQIGPLASACACQAYSRPFCRSRHHRHSHSTQGRSDSVGEDANLRRAGAGSLEPSKSHPGTGSSRPGEIEYIEPCRRVAEAAASLHRHHLGPKQPDSSRLLPHFPHPARSNTFDSISGRLVEGVHSSQRERVLAICDTTPMSDLAIQHPPETTSRNSRWTIANRQLSTDSISHTTLPSNGVQCVQYPSPPPSYTTSAPITISRCRTRPHRHEPDHTHVLFGWKTKKTTATRPSRLKGSEHQTRPGVRADEHERPCYHRNLHRTSIPASPDIVR